MPTVPAAGYDTGPAAPPQIDPRLPVDDFLRIDARPEAFGGAVGTALTRAGGELEKGAGELAQAAISRQGFINEKAADDASTTYMKESHKLLYGDQEAGTNPVTGKLNKPGFYALEGQDAVNAGSPSDALDRLQQSISGSLPNDQARLKFNTETRRLRTFTDAQVYDYYNKQLKAAGVDTLTAKGDLYDREVATAYNDPAKFAQILELAQQDVTKKLQIEKGTNADPAILADGRAQELAKLYGSAYRAAIADGQLERAGALKNEAVTRGIWTGQQADEAERLIEPKRNQQIGKDAGRAGFTGGGGGGGALNIPTGPIPDAISAAAPQAGVSARLAMGTASIESGFGQSPDRAGSQYKGVFQLGDKEWEQMGGGDRNDRQLQIDHGLRLLAQRKTELAQSLGREPADWEVYLAHQQGVAGATALIQNPNMTAGQAVTQAGGAPVNISGNGGDPNAPASAFTAHWQQTFERHASRATPAAPSVAGGAAPPPATGAPIAIGDSIARGFQKFGGAGGTGKDLDAADTTVHAAGGRSPSTILTYLKSQPDGSLNGQPVLLSTGVSNGPGQINLVPEQLAELKRMGAGPISVVGVGTKAGEEGGNRYDLNKYNAQIEQAAKAAGATFLGGLPAVVHPAASYYTGAMPKPAATGKPQTAPEGAIISSPGKPPMQNVGGKWVPYLPEGV